MPFRQFQQTVIKRTSSSPWPYSALLFAYFIFVGFYSPYLSLYLEHRQFSAVEIGVLMSLMQATRIVGPYGWGWLADHTGHPLRLLRLSAFLSIPLFASLAVGSSFAAMFCLLILLNLSTAAQTPLTESLAIHALKGQVQYYGRIRLWGSIGFVVAVLLGGVVLDRVSFDFYPGIGAALLVVLFLVAALMKSQGHGLEVQAHGSVTKVLRQRPVQWFFVSAFLMVFAHAVLYAYYSLYLARLGYSSSVIGLLWALGVIAEITFFFFQARFLQRFSLNHLLLVSFALCALRFTLIGSVSQSWLCLVFAQLLHAFTFAMHHSASIATVQHYFPGRLAMRGQALYVVVAYGLGGCLGGFAATYWWSTFSPSAAFFGSGAVGVIGLWVCWKMRQALQKAPLLETKEIKQ